MPKTQKLKADQVSINITNHNTSSLEVTIKTPRLQIISINHTAISALSSWRLSLVTLFTNPEVMKYFALGSPLAPPAIQSLIKDRQELWKTKDPLNAFCIFLKTNESAANQICIGYIALNHTNTPNNITINLALMPQYWRQGFGTEAASAIINHYIPNLIKNHPQLITATLQLDSRESTSLCRIRLNVRMENTAARLILAKIGFTATTQTFFCGNQQIEYIIQGDDQQQLAEKLQADTLDSATVRCAI